MKFKTKYYPIILALIILIAAPLAVAAATTTSIVSFNTLGQPATGDSTAPAISPDGRYVVFASTACDLVIGVAPCGPHIYRYDRTTNSNLLVDLTGSSAANGTSGKPTMSADGRFVAFRSLATNLVTGIGNGVDGQIFVRDITTYTTIHVSKDSSNVTMVGSSDYPVMSGNGRYVAFTVSAGPLTNLYLRDRDFDGNGSFDEAGTDKVKTTLVSFDRTTGLAAGSTAFFLPSISSNGRFLAYISDYANMVAGDTNGVADAFVYDIITNTNKRISVGAGNTQGLAATTKVVIADNGLVAAFETLSTNIVSGSGLTAGTPHVFIKNITNDSPLDYIWHVSNAKFGDTPTSPDPREAWLTGSPNAVHLAGISADGRFVTMYSQADNMTGTTKTNGSFNDFYMRDRSATKSTLISLSSGDAQGNDNSQDYASPSFSGRYIAFQSDARNFAGSDATDTTDVFLRDVGATGSAPGKAAPTAPSGTITADRDNATNTAPTFTWPAVSGAEGYYLWVNSNTTGTLMTVRYYAGDLGCLGGGTCTVKPRSFPHGAYTFWVQAYNAAGNGAWSNPVYFSVVVTPPPAAVLVSPNIDSAKVWAPDYIWNMEARASKYYLWVSGPTGKVFDKWYTTDEANCDDAANPGLCKVAAPVTLTTPGTHYWWILTANSGGNGAWSSAKQFMTPAPPATPVLQSPTGAINSATAWAPTFRWNKLANADIDEWYVYVAGPAGVIWDSSGLTAGSIPAPSTVTGVICNTTFCQWTPSEVTWLFNNGNYKWWAQAGNSEGRSPWSSPLSFSVVPGPPDTPTLISPQGTITTTRPEFKWNKVINADRYYVWVNGPSSNVLATIYTAQTADPALDETMAYCTASTCTVHPVLSLGTGTHTWWVLAMGPGGNSAWSTPMTFNTPTPPPPPTIVSPTASGSYSTYTFLSPDYRWSKVQYANEYRIWVTNSSNARIDIGANTGLYPTGDGKWWTLAQVGCSNAYDTTCTLSGALPATIYDTTYASGLPPGTYRWWVQGRDSVSGSVGYWSPGAQFTITLNAPGQPSPLGTVVGPTQTAYSWNTSTGATWYYLWSGYNNAGSLVLLDGIWCQPNVTAGCVEAAGTVTFTRNNILHSGANVWWVIAWNSTGYSPWSVNVDFIIP